VSDATGRGVFEHLSAPVRDALAERGFTEPTEPQRRAIQPLAAGEDGLVIAPTGSGKTETAMLPVFSALADGDAAWGISALYVTPLRALNRDMRERLDWWGDELGLEVDVRHGDTTDYRRRQQAQDPPDVLVTTPETLQAMLTGEKLRQALSCTEHVVIDEIHELAASKRGAQLAIGLERLREVAGIFRRIGLSATVGDPEEVGRFLTGGDDPALIEVDAGSRLDLTVTSPDVTDADERLATELVCEPEIASHVRAIREIVAENESTLVFVNTRQTAEAMGSRFKSIDASVGVHHGSLSKEARIDVEDRFKAGGIDALLCTSSMELGIDVGRVDHVVQYGSPREVTRLLQRVGRAGHRADRVSRGTIVTRGGDDTMEALAIARRALEGESEPADIHHGSLDTVANQIAGIVMDEGEVDAREALEIVRRAYPFRDLAESAFKSVLRELGGNRVVWLEEDEDRIEKRRGTWQYFYRNLSMIPDEETYEVYDMAAGERVGTLDERFVVDFAEPGATFIQRGELWRIAEVDEEEARVKATPMEDPGGEVPAWTGQEIPVPCAVAKEVGEIRGVAASQFEAGADRASVGRDIAGRYPADPDTIAEALEPIEAGVADGQPTPTDERVVIEAAGGTVVINVAAGHRANETIGRVVSSLLGQAAGSAVGMEIDPYRVELDVPRGVDAADVREILLDTDPAHVESLLELALKRSETLGFRLSQIATTFGALKRWQGSGEGIGVNRLLAALEDTPVYEEAVRSIFHDDLDAERAAELLAELQAGGLALATADGRTPIGMAGRSSGQDLLTPEDADASVIEAVKERLQEDRVRLFCLHCEGWERTTQVKRAPENPACPDCGSTRIAALHPMADEVVQAVQSNDKSEEQADVTERAHRRANLVQAHGKQAIVALAARGVGPTNAARIIAKLREDEDDFYRDILAREREYARTRSFWD
jgi:ATP-dependent Lhr-like helicase